MSWKQINKSNAIERVRLYVQFGNPIISSILDEISKSIIDQHEQLGFEKPEPTRTIVQNLPENLELGIPFTERVSDGWVLNRGPSENDFVERVGLRCNVFGYVVTEYEQWTSFYDRYIEIFKEPLQGALENSNVSSVKLECFNKFVFDGDSAEADISKILRHCDPILEKSVNFKDIPWHTELGWYEPFDNYGLISQLTHNAVDVIDEDKSQRQLKIEILVDLQNFTEKMSIVHIQEYLQVLHEKANFLFENSINQSIYEQMK